MARVDIRAEKNNLRKEFKKYRLEMSKQEKASKDFEILNRVVSLPEYKNAKMLLTYVSTDIEVDTKSLIEGALIDGKTVLVPKCVDGKIDMKFYKISSISDLKPGAFGVLEPENCEQVSDFSDAVCILPGLGFDLQGYRLGYGKGYYDRFLANFKGKNIGVCYNICLKALIPHGKYDKMVDVLVTEKFVKRFNSR